MKRILLFVIAAVALIGCGRADYEPVAMHIDRFDSALWTLDRANVAGSLDSLQAHYPDITPVYLERVVEFGAVGDTLTTYTLQRFFADTAVAQLYGATLARFADMADYEAQLGEAFGRVKSEFPDKSTPRFYTHISGLNQSMVVGDGFISASIDNYLGGDYPLYEKVGIYGYLRQNMRPEKLVPDYVMAWLLSEFPFRLRTGELQEEMVYRGKILYATSALLPDLPDSLLIGYTAAQWDWCKKYEHDMWMTMVGQRHLFSHDATLRAKYLNDAPFTKPFTQQSPGRAGAYVGWQIVKKYMRSHRQMSLRELMLRPDDEIAREAKYDP